MLIAELFIYFLDHFFTILIFLYDSYNVTASLIKFISKFIWENMHLHKIYLCGTKFILYVKITIKYIFLKFYENKNSFNFLKIIERMKENSNKLINKVKKLIVPFLNNLNENISIFVNIIIRKLKNYSKFIAKYINSFRHFISKLKIIFKEIKVTFISFKNFFVTTIKNKVAICIIITKNFSNYILSFFKELWEKNKLIIKEYANKIRQYFKNLIDELIESLSANILQIKSFIFTKIYSIMLLLNILREYNKNYLIEVCLNLKLSIMMLKNFIKENLLSFRLTITQYFISIKYFLLDSIKDLGNSIKNMFTEIINYLKDIKESIKERFVILKEYVKEIISSLIISQNEAIHSIKRIFF